MSKISKNILTLIIILFITFEISFADVLYYKNNFKITNCRVLSFNEEKYEIQTITKTGLGVMTLPAYVVDVVVSQNIDSTVISEIIPKTKNDEIITKHLREIKNEEDKNIAIEEKNRIDRENKLKEIEKREKIRIAKMKNNQKISGDYYIKSNIPLLATGVALTTQGLIYLISTAQLNEQIEENIAIIPMPDTTIDKLRSELSKAYIYGTLFTIAGIIDIYYSFEKVSVEIESNQLTFSYNF